MFKKILSGILIIIYSISFSSKSFAVETLEESVKKYCTSSSKPPESIESYKVQEVKPPSKTQESPEEKLQKQANERYKANYIKEYGISCLESPDAKDCSYLTVKIEDQNLDSYLANHYRAYKINIKNNYEKSIEIVNLKGFFYENPQEEISKTINKKIQERNKERFTFLSILPTATFLWVVLLPAVPVMFVMPPDDETVAFAKGPVYWICKGTWYTLAAPYYRPKDKKADELAMQEAKNAQNYSSLKLKPKEEIQLTLLSFKQLQLRIQFKKDGEDTITKINYDSHF